MEPETTPPQTQPPATPPAASGPAAPFTPPVAPQPPVPPLPPTNPEPAVSSPEPPAAASAESLPSTPESWPGAFSIYKYAKAATQINVGTLILFWLISFVLGTVVGLKYKAVGDGLSLVLGSLATAGYTLAYVAGVRRQKLSFGPALKAALPLWPKMIVLNILVSLSLGLSFLLLVIPFFFVWPRLMLAPYLLVDQKLGILEAYKASWHQTKGHASKVWGIIGATTAMGLLVLTIIGIPFAIYFLIMYSSAIAVLYEYLLKATPVPAEMPPATPGV